MANAVLGISLLFFLGHALKWIFLKTKVPDILVLIVLGYFLGPVFGLVHASDFGKVGNIMATVALIVILYEGGLQLRIEELARSFLSAAGVSIIGFTLISSLACAMVWTFTNQTWQTAVLFGLAIGCTSAAVVIPMVKVLDISPRTKTLLSLESAFTDVLAIVSFLVVADAVELGKFSLQKLMIGLGPNTFMAVLVGIGSALFWSFLRRRDNPVTKIRFSGEAWAAATYGFVELFHFSGPMAVLALGFVLGNLNILPDSLKNFFHEEPISVEAQALLEEVTFLLKTFFFIFLGLLINFSNSGRVIFCAGIASLILLTRYLFTRLILKPKDYSRTDVLTVLAMGSRGLASAVLGTLAVQRGLPGSLWLRDTLFTLIPMTIGITALLIIFSNQSWFKKWSAKLFGSYPENLDSQKELTPEIQTLQEGLYEPHSEDGSKKQDSEGTVPEKSLDTKKNEVQLELPVSDQIEVPDINEPNKE